MASGIPFPMGYAVLIALLGLILVQRLSQRKPKYPLPPGPRPLPIIGSVLDLPAKGIAEYAHWTKLKDAYGPISSITVMGQRLVLFHDRDAAHAVMGKKGQKTSARPQMNFATLCGFEEFLITHQYDAKYRLHRKMVMQQIGTRQLSAAFQPVQDQESLRFILQIFKDPNRFIDHLKTLAAAIILQATYGYAIDRDGDDPLAGLIEKTMDNLSQAFVPLAWLVDAVPAIRYLPDWFPGTSYRKTAWNWKSVNEASAELPYAFAKRQWAQKAHRPSYVSNLLEAYTAKQKHSTGESRLAPADEEGIKWTAVSLYAAGWDSTIATVESAMLAFLLFPDVVQRAQAEIDRVVGPDRLPGFDDRPALPYIDGIVKEALRWNTVIPMGLARKSEEDIVCGEYIIPKGSYLLASLWWMLHDPKYYSEPEVFKPERYQAPLNEPDPDSAFGYGRRACAGRYFADASIYITLVRLLAVFDVRRAKDAQGNEIPVRLESVSGVVNHPQPYRFRIEPRSAHHADLLRRVDALQDPVVGDAHLLDVWKGKSL